MIEKKLLNFNWSPLVSLSYDDPLTKDIHSTGCKTKNTIITQKVKINSISIILQYPRITMKNGCLFLQQERFFRKWWYRQKLKCVFPHVVCSPYDINTLAHIGADSSIKTCNSSVGIRGGKHSVTLMLYWTIFTQSCTKANQLAVIKVQQSRCCVIFLQMT